jgi:plastocyanin
MKGLARSSAFIVAFTFAASALPAPTGAVAGTVTLTKDGSPKKDASSIVVYLENVPVTPPPEAEKFIHQRELTFSPGLLVIVKGTTVSFPNDDKVFHNVFSISKAAKFDLGLYKSGTSKSVTFDTPGVIDVYCNIHPQMVAKIRVVDNQFYAVTKADGAFRIPNVPPGTYPIVAWQAYGEQKRGEVVVAAGGTATTRFTLAEGQEPQRHLRKDGTPYGRYK